MSGKKVKYQVVAVSGHFGGLYEVGYWTRPRVKSGWVPLASVNGATPDAPTVQAAVRALQAVVSDPHWDRFLEDGGAVEDGERVEVVIGIKNGLFEQAGVYRNPKRASQEADELRKEYGITAAEGAGVETNNAVIHLEGVEIEEGDILEREKPIATDGTLLDVDDVQAFLDLITLAEDKRIIKLREVEELKGRLGID